MALDPSIFARFAPKSVAEFDQEAYATEGARQATQMNALKLLAGQRAEQDAQRALQEQTGMRNALAALGARATDEQRVNALRGLGTQTGFSQADALEKSITERRSKISEAEKREFDVARDRLSTWNNMLSGVNDEASYQAAIPQAVQLGLKPEQLPTQFDPNMVAAAKQRALTEQQRLEDAAKQRGYDLQAAGQAQQLSIAKLNDDRIRSEGAANRGVTMRGQNIAQSTAMQGGSVQMGADGSMVVVPNKFTPGQPVVGAPVVGADGQPIKGAPKGRGAMSATLQKELIESDDLANTANQTASTLRKALDLNDKAYSGFGANVRAQVRSNLPGQSQAADATVDLNNLIGEQALSGMKAIFGGNPTEGERAILLDLQASADKTPAQRKAIIERGIAAAERRAKISTERAKSIRSGTYLSEGDDDASPAPASSGGFKYLGAE